MPKQKDNASANTRVAVTEWDTVIAVERTSGGIGYLVQHVACVVGSTYDIYCSGKWAIDRGATDHFADPALPHFWSARVSNNHSIHSKRSYVTVGGRRTLRATGYGDMVGTVYNDQGVQVSVERSDVLIAPVLGRCLFSPSVTSRVGTYAMYFEV